MRAESLRNFACGIVFEDEAGGLGLLCAALRFVVRFFLISTFAIGGVGVAGIQRPEPHGGKARVFFEAGGVGVRENHREGFFGDGGPDLLQIFLERDSLAAGFLHAGIAGKDFQSRAETGEDGVRSDDAFLGQTRHPFVDAAGQLLQHVAPIADFVRAHRAIGILARAADEMD